MNDVLNLVVPLPPSANSYLGKKVGYSNGNPYVIVYETAEAKKYKALIIKLVSKAKSHIKWKQTDKNTYVICELDIYLSRKRRDSDNCFKVLLDALNNTGLVYDDSMFIPRVRDIIIDPENPRIELTLKVSEKIGVFNRLNYNFFIENNCFKCKKDMQKCSFLKKSLENKIIKEIDLKCLTCNKIKWKN